MNKCLGLLIDQAFERLYYCIIYLKRTIGEKVMAENQKEPSRGLPPGIPRWLKLIIIVFIVLVAAVVVLHLMGFGFGSHGAINNAEMLARVQINHVILIGKF
jgi:flagellar basal body-associated protein FliL